MNSDRCAVCKALGVDCPPNCICAPHFPPKDKKFYDVNLFYGAKNIRKILNGFNTYEQRSIAAKALYFGAESRKRDPILGASRMRLELQSNINKVEEDIQKAKNTLQSLGMGPDELPKFFDLPFPNEVLTTPNSMNSFIQMINNLTDDQKIQIMENFERSVDQNMGGGYGAHGASTSGVGNEDDGASTSGGAGPSGAGPYRGVN